LLTHPSWSTNTSQAYNSVFNTSEPAPRLVGNFPLFPLRTKIRGPVYPLPFPDPPLPADESPDPNSESYDILDEVLALFRANTFFRNFEIQGPADRLLVYGIWFVSDCLTKIKPTANLRDATKDVTNLALDLNFAIPGDPAWPLNQVRCPNRMGLDERGWSGC
jgi:actin related protein 2/3 complex subunit 3